MRHRAEADRMNTSQIRITTKCGSGIVLLRTYIGISLTKCCLQVISLSHLFTWRNWQSFHDFSSLIYFNIIYLLLVKAKNQEDNPAGTGWIMAGTALWSFKKIYLSCCTCCFPSVLRLSHFQKFQKLQSWNLNFPLSGSAVIE